MIKTPQYTLTPCPLKCRNSSGIVRDDLSKSEAGSLARGLRDLGVIAEILDVKNPDSKKGYQLTLLDAGSKKIAVIKAIRGITGLGLKEAKELVENLGVVGVYKIRKEAEQVKKILTSDVAKVSIKKLGGESPKPQPQPEPTEDRQGGAYRVRLVSTGRKKIALIKTVREITGLGLKEAKEIVDGLGVVAEDLTRGAAEKIQEKLALDGAKSSVEHIKGPHPPYRDSFIVFGQVLLSDGQPLEACIVRVFDRDLRSEQLLGDTLTDGNGSYRVIYTEEQFKQVDNEKADLVVRAFNPVGKLLSESAIHFNVSSETHIDLIVSESAPVQPSEYDWLVSILTPLLDGVYLPDLTREDVWFLANKTGRGLDEVSFLADDARLAQSTGMPEAVFFALASEQAGVLSSDGPSPSQADFVEVPAPELSTLLEQPIESLLDILRRAISNNLIPVELGDQLDEIQNRFESLKEGKGM